MSQDVFFSRTDLFAFLSPEHIAVLSEVAPDATKGACLLFA